MVEKLKVCTYNITYMSAANYSGLQLVPTEVSHSTLTQNFDIQIYFIYM